MNARLQRVLMVLLTCAMVIVPVRAEIIRGTVTDSLTRGPVDSVLVQIKGSMVQTYTDSAGRFSFNTSDVISRKVPLVADRALGSATTLSIWNATGALAAKKTGETAPAALFADLPTGIYLVRTHTPTGVMIGRVLKTDYNTPHIEYAQKHRAEVPAEIRANAGLAAITFVYTHKYYTSKEATVNPGDTAVNAQLRMWYPTAQTAGPTNRANLTTITSRTISTAGTRLENVLVNGTITIKANNVTVHNFKSVVDDYFAFDITGTAVLLENGEIDGQNTCDEAIRGSGYTARNLYIHNMEGDAFKANGKNVIENCYITAIGQGDGAHGDGVQMMVSGDIRIIHNNFDLTTGELTACVFPGGGGYIPGVFVKYNRLVGGSYIVYCNADMIATNNVFGANTYGTHTDQCGTWTWNVRENGAAINP